MTFAISWEIEGEKQLSRRLRGVTTDLQDFKKPFRTSANYLKSIYEREVFATKGAVINERWARLSPATVAAKARSGYPVDPLVRTGKMKRGFRSVVTSDSATIGNNTDYFKYHQSNKPRTKIPRRVMMKIANTQRENIVRVFYSYIRDAVK